ncbi:MAG: Nucleotide diphosphatase [Verrucomicrobia bacterium]|nr:Nucleotide diphosphatase [Verrucomicrobiota bacterium]
MKGEEILRDAKAALRLMLLLVLGFVSGCVTAPETSVTPPLLLISLDGFRWDYFAKYPAETVNLRHLLAEGSSARELIPVFPSNTFPNHYTIVTGLYPAHHGVINNEMFDPGTQRFFRYNRANSVRESEWWGGEPIWVTAIRQGHPAATSFWTGSEASIGGVHATFWKSYDPKIPFEKRLEELLSWMRLPAEQRPVVVTFYLEETNSVGHKFGPDSKELAATVKLLDGRVGTMLARLKAEGQVLNVVIVSDHGMTEISADRVTLLDDYLDLSSVQIDFSGPVVGLRPLEGTAESVVRALSALPHARACLARDLPERFHLVDNPRIPPVWIVPDEGWEIETRRYFETIRFKFNHGDHGYDPALSSMHGILLAHGPSFKSGVAVDPVENIHIYNLLCAALRLTPARNDGDDRLVRAFLRVPAAPDLNRR